MGNYLGYEYQPEIPKAPPMKENINKIKDPRDGIPFWAIEEFIRENIRKRGVQKL